MLVLKKKHLEVVDGLKREVVRLEEINDNRLMKIAALNKDLKIEMDINLTKEANIFEKTKKIEKLELKNSKLNTELVAEKEKVRQLEDANHELHQELEQYQNRVVELEKELNKYKKTCDHLGKVYNKMNVKLWANHEAQRQIRNLSVDVLEADRINKPKLSKYLQDLSMLIGGGESFAYAGLKDDTEESVG